MEQPVKLESVIDFVKRRFTGMQSLDPGLRAHLIAIRDHVDTYEKAVSGLGVAQLALAVGMDGVTLPDVEHAALSLLEQVESLPELRASGRVTDPNPASASADPGRDQLIPVMIEDEDGPARARYQAISGQLRTSGRVLLLVGGRVVQPKLQWVRAVLLGADGCPNGGAEIEWIPTEDDPDAKACVRIVNQMKAGTVLAVITFPEFMAHAQTDALLRGGRETGIPVAYAGRGGQAQFLAAFAQLESQLGRAPT
jgi:hypothetical protein